MKIKAKRAIKTFSMSMILLLLLTAPAAGLMAHAAGKDAKAPTRPAGLSALDVSSAAVKLSWQRSSDNIGVSGYLVYRNGTYLAYSTVNHYTVSGLKPGTAYKFFVVARDRSGNRSVRSRAVVAKTKEATAASTAAKAVTTAKAPAHKLVVGYCASWGAYSGYTPRDIPAAYLTDVIYAFANIDGSYRITLGDSKVDPANLADLKALKKKYPRLKTLISVGGWDWSDKFSNMASTASRRSAFAGSVAAFLKKYGLDGVDLDWEYPVGGGEAGNSASPADRTNFTLLLQTLRSRLNSEGKADGKSYLLSIAGGAGTDYIGHVQLSSIAKYVSFATVMTYDMHGAYDAYTDLNAPLYPSTDSPQEVWSADQAVRAWEAAGFPKSKLVMGVPFYGHLYTHVLGGGTGIYDTFSNMSMVTYDKIVSAYLSKSAYKKRYASEGKTPWLFNGTNFITYEDPVSISTKAAYIKSRGIAGAGIWELSENTNGKLLKTLYKGLK